MATTVEQLTDDLSVHWHPSGATTIRIGSGGVGQAITLTSDESRLVAKHLAERPENRPTRL